MRIHKAPLMAAVVAVTMGATACSENGTPLTAPEETASFQRNVGQATFGNLIAALNNIAVNIENLQVLNNLINVGDINAGDINLQVVRVGDVLSGNNVNALNNALNRNQVNIGVLQNLLNNNTLNVDLQNVLTNFLNNNNIDIRDVVAIGVNVDTGTIIVFAR